MSQPQQMFIGRQPVLDRKERIVAYELLFRDSADAQFAVIDEARTAVSRVMVNTFATMGARAVLGPCRGFFNVDRETFLSDMVEALPRERVTIEILETIDADDDVCRRAAELQKAGFSLALDDYVVNDPREPLLEWVECVKVDLLAVSDRALPDLVRRLRRHPVALLAEKVETREMFERCHKLGFELFQGYYFARPEVISGASVDPARGVVLQLLQQLGQDVDTATLCETLKQHADLGVNLLRIVNSAVVARRHKITGVKDAVTFLGRRHLQRWLNVLLFAGADSDGFNSPLLITAARRGRMMELLSSELIGGDGVSDKEGRAFLVGMLSLIDVLLGRPTGELLDELGLDQEITSAIVDHAGALGALLQIVEGIERGDFESVSEMSAKIGLGADTLFHCELRANRWVHELSGVGSDDEDDQADSID